MKEIIADVGVNHMSIVMLENGEPAEFMIETQDDNRMIGNIYKGIVQNVLPGMQAAFIDVGIDKNVFLYVKDILSNVMYEDAFNNTNGNKEQNISGLLKTGQSILVQVIKEPIGTKGARVTTNVTLPGRYTVLMPTVDYIGISRRIEDEKERERLKRIAQTIKPKDMGIIIRTVGQDCEEADLVEDINFLVKLWEGIKSKSQNNNATSVIHSEMNLLDRTVRDLFTKEIDKFVINNKNEFERVIELVEIISPSLKNRVECYTNNIDIFAHYHIDVKLSKILNRKIWLDCGGYIVIDQTEALTSIDVNTGKFVGTFDLQDTVLKTNIEAAREIAKQLRLRDIGGIVIIDFIDMVDEEHKMLVIESLKSSLKKDRTKTNVLGMTQLGLVEMTRKKVRQRVENVLQSACPYCRGTGKILSLETIAYNIEKEIHKTFMRNDIKALYIEVHPDVEEYIRGKDDKRIECLQEAIEKIIIFKGSSTLHIEQFNIELIQNKEIIDKIHVM